MVTSQTALEPERVNPDAAGSELLDLREACSVPASTPWMSVEEMRKPAARGCGLWCAPPIQLGIAVDYSHSEHLRG
jgi:hypothetical protein